jgi:hypothetical protein
MLIEGFIMQSKNPIFEKNYHAYLNDLSGLDLSDRAEVLDITVEKQSNTTSIPYFGQKYSVSAEGVVGTSGQRPGYEVCVVLLKYLLMCPKQLPTESDWVTYRELKDSGPLAAYFSNNALGALTKNYEKRRDVLESVASFVGGVRPQQNYPYDVAVEFRVLPRIPILLLFNDKDEEFDAQTAILFERRADRFLDAECLAMVAGYLPVWLKKAEGSL